jgi:outer membrane immunogenic protein
MKLLRTVVLALGAAGFALGAATSAKATDPSWTGFYVGASAGTVSEESAWFIPGVVTTPTSSDDGAIYGGTVGFGFKSGVWVFGIEGDWSKTDLDVGPISACGGNCRTSAEWLATLRARVGFLVSPSTLLYATGGAAWAEIKGTAAGVSEKETATGWTWGGGFEVKLDKHWSVKGEYLRVELDDTLVCGTVVCGAENFSHNKLDVLRAGVNFKF